MVPDSILKIIGSQYWILIKLLNPFFKYKLVKNRYLII